MGDELNSEWYDEVFRHGGSEQIYFLKYDETPWYPIWKKIAARIKELGSTKILDIGCGPGQFADCLLNEIGLVSYVGIDFSSAAISFAEELSLPVSFVVADATDYDYSQIEYDVVVTTEFLEHIHDDLGVLSKISKGSVILATLPNMDSEGHVRFLSKDVEEAILEIEERYSDLCEIVSIQHFPYELNPENADFLIEMIRR
jgi:2-polyprenyl-3-methyl-5-hydroxy-6-metoxy-1,4-benzoquinol methylase